MDKEFFSPMAIDALGEMMNISLGSSATAVSNMLDHRVDITTPTVSVVDVKDFTLGNLEPAIGVEIKYVEGLEGSNIMLLKRSDIKIIVDILMGMETADEDFELNELTISCVCEVMNQMMGSAATAMSDFLGFRVDISTPQSFELDNLEEFKASHLPVGADQIVVVRFFLKIENALESEFMNVMSVELAKELLKGLGLGDDGAEEAAPAPAPAPEPAASSSGVNSFFRVTSQAGFGHFNSGLSAIGSTEQPGNPNLRGQWPFMRWICRYSRTPLCFIWFSCVAKNAVPPAACNMKPHRSASFITAAHPKSLETTCARVSSFCSFAKTSGLVPLIFTFSPPIFVFAGSPRRSGKSSNAARMQQEDRGIPLPGGQRVR